jgi:hypothetical protein
MIPARNLPLLVLAASARAPALAQEASAWIGAPDCRLAPVSPAPAQAPAWKGGCKAVTGGQCSLCFRSDSSACTRVTTAST